ncbi:alpha-N-acetylgalactosaminide alpha-2,6-sialyltransferase 3-like [Ptychodera flava]|uniref:alpha-N-acetylgalactosaminide alpha-2,6-sialyltransferase 3-like n=1 Tax=Ptychodera flava TaxID=63121 RepID=UPI00396A5758
MKLRKRRILLIVAVAINGLLLLWYTRSQLPTENERVMEESGDNRRGFDTRYTGDNSRKHIHSMELLHSGNNVSADRARRPANKETRTSLQRSNPVKYSPHGYVSMANENKKLSLRCDVCALVSSSGQLLNSKAGREIDQASCVIRMNDAPVNGYEEDVGSKTTIRIVSFVAVKTERLVDGKVLEKPHNPNTLVLWTTYRQGISKVILKLYGNLSRVYPHTDFYYATEAQNDFADEVFLNETGKSRVDTGTWLSSGWFTMLFAMQHCNQIRVYGMIDADHCSRRKNIHDAPYHYYNNPFWSFWTLRECDFYRQNEASRNAHRFMTEKYIFRKWSKRFNITFHHPSWTLTDSEPKIPVFLNSGWSRACCHGKNIMLHWYLFFSYLQIACVYLRETCAWPGTPSLLIV